MELVERVAICEIEIENVKEKVDKQDKLIDSIYELASGQKELNAKMDSMEEDLSSVKKDVKDMQLQPARDYKKLGFEVVRWALIFILGYMEMCIRDSNLPSRLYSMLCYNYSGR